MAKLYVLLVAVNLIIGCCGKKSKLVLFLSYSFIVLLMALNTAGPDFLNYYNDYVLSAQGKHEIKEIGYFALSYLLNLLKFDFFTFRILVAFACLYLIQVTINTFKANCNLVIGLYMLYVIFMDTIQIRNFIMEAILIFSLRYLFVRKNFNSLKYAICIIIASLFHRIALLYLILLLVKFKADFRMYKCLLVISCVSFIFFFINRSALSEIISLIAEMANLSKDYTLTVTRFSSVMVVVLCAVEMIVLLICNKKLKSKSNSFEQNFIRIFIIISLLMPLLLINFNFYRIIRNLSIAKYIAIALFFEKLNKRSVSSVLLSTVFASSTVGWFVMDYVLVNEFTVTIVSIFQNNLIILNSYDGINYIICLKLIMIVLMSMIIVLPIKKRKRIRV